MNKIVFYKIRRLFKIILPVCLLLCITAAKAQDTRISIHEDNVPMVKVINQIETKTRYLFVIKNNDVDTNKSVSIHVDDKTIPEVLSVLFQNSGYSYTIEGMNVYVSKTQADNKPLVVRGNVSDKAGEPIIGATVLVKGTTIGTSTGIDGNFTLQIPPPLGKIATDNQLLRLPAC